MYNIFQTINHQYKKPLNFDENNPEFEVFKVMKEEDCHFPEPQFMFFKNMRVSANSVIFNYFNVIEESCIPKQSYLSYSSGFRFFFKFIFPKIHFHKKRFLLITDEWTSNYYHWHNFALNKLVALQQKGMLKDTLILLPKKYLKYKFVLPSLAKFGVTKDQIVLIPKKSNIKTKHLTTVIAPRQHSEVFKTLRQVLTKDHEKIDLGFGDKIYISREGQLLRFVENEKEVMAMLEKYGFKKIIIDKFSYDEQVAICAKAKYLIAPHGAGITNALFMTEGGYLLEMVTTYSRLNFNIDFYALSTLINLNYLYMECEAGPNSRVQDRHQASLVIDLKKLEENVKLMLKNG